MAKADHRDFYTQEASEYEATRYGSKYGSLFRTLQRNAVDRALQSCPQIGRVLDVASGTGQMLPSLAAAAGLVVASDLTPAMLAVARENSAAHDAIVYCVADATRLPYTDGCFDSVASSRFLHLFKPEQQQSLIIEMARVLAPGGTLIVDFYSASARRIFGPPIWAYRRLLRKRPENDHRVSMAAAKRMVEHAGLNVGRIEGVGNFLLAPILWLPHPWLLRLGEWSGRTLSSMSEQFVIVARKP